MLKVVLADNQTIFRAGAAKVLAVEDEVRIVAQAQTAEQMYMALERFRPAVLVAAASVEPDIEKLVRTASKTQSRLVMIGENSDPTSRFTSCGVGGVVYRNVNGQALLECVQSVAGGKAWVQDGRASEPVSDQDMVGARVRDRLTPKELRIVALIVQGYKNKEIATQLGTTEQVI